MERDIPKVNPIEDQRKEALRHYEEAARIANHLSSFVRNAILAYNPQPSEQKPPEDVSKGAEEFWNKIVYTQHVESGDEAYIIEKDDFMKAMNEYASIQRNEAIQECIELVIERIRNAGRAEQNGGAEYYPFDSMSLENIVGMRRAYAELKLELETLKHNP